MKLAKFTEENSISDLTKKVFNKIDQKMRDGPGTKTNRKSKWVPYFSFFNFEHMKSLPRLKVNLKFYFFIFTNRIVLNYIFFLTFLMIVFSSCLSFANRFFGEFFSH